MNNFLHDSIVHEFEMYACSYEVCLSMIMLNRWVYKFLCACHAMHELSMP